jgi:hypothetical protein
MWYLEPLIGLLCFLWLMIGALLASRGSPNWQPKGEAFLGLSGTLFCGLVLYLRLSSRANAFYIEKGFLAGMTIGIFVTLWLEGSWNLLKKLGKRRQPDAGTEKPGKAEHN